MLQLQLLGGFRAVWQGEVLSLKGRQRALLAVLGLSGRCSRLELSRLLWGQEGGHNLRQALYLLRRLPGAGQWLGDGDLLYIRAEVDALRPSLEQLRLPLLPDLPPDLPEAFWDWLELERRRLEELRRERLWQAAQAEPAQARPLLYELLSLEPLHETACRALMRLEAEAGFPELALQQFERLREALKREMGSEPLPATLALAQSLQAAPPSPLARRLQQAWALRPQEGRADFWAAVLEASALEIAQAQDELAALGWQPNLPPTSVQAPLERYLHQRIAETLAQQQADQPAAIAYHWCQAQNAPQAYPWALRAGRQALEQGELKAAREHLFRAVWMAPQGQERLEALHALAQLAEQQSDLELLEAVCAALGQLAWQTQDDRCFFEYHHRSAGLCLRQGRPHPAAEQAQEALEAARRLGQPEQVCMAELTLGAAWMAGGALAQAQAHLSRAAQAQNPTVRLRALSNLGALMGLQGAYQASHDHIEQALALARQTGQRALVGSLLQNLAATTLRLGQYARATRRFEEALSLARSLGDRRTEAVCYRNLGYLYFLQGQFGSAWNTLEEALELALQLEPALQGQVLLVQVELLCYLDQFERAAERLAQAQQRAEAVGDARLKGACRYNQALLRLLQQPADPSPVLAVLRGLEEARLGDLVTGAGYDLLAWALHPPTLADWLARLTPQTPLQHLAWQMGRARQGLLTGQPPDPHALALALAGEPLSLSSPGHQLLADLYAADGAPQAARQARAEALQHRQRSQQGLPRFLRSEQQLMPD